MYGTGRKYADKVGFCGMRCMEPAVNMQSKWASMECDVWNPLQICSQSGLLWGAMYGTGRKHVVKVGFYGVRCMEPAVNMQSKWVSMGCDV